MMRTADLDYSLPPELIAQTPLPRGEARLLVLHRRDGSIEHRTFRDLKGYLRPGDTLVLNDTRVTARRLYARTLSNARVELLLIRPIGDTDWEALVRPGRKCRVGSVLQVEDPNGNTACLTVAEVTQLGGRILRAEDEVTRDALGRSGSIPTPPYIHVPLEDEERYQTVYARNDGSAAAPTAGLHFTRQMLDDLARSGVKIVHVTLHVGTDTFRPVKTATLEEHPMHGEWYHISNEAAHAVNNTPGRIVAAGTTVVRTLESAAGGKRCVRSGSGETTLFITPGFEFQVVDALITNFHLPRSTLIALVAAFAGRDKVMAAYAEAVDARYRFYSFGDAMLIV
ncbi:MAG: tRNA preQ1(34) S-adenosylmethionine ribosyltransferase-isomerase QueA [Chthonomonadales bacterium]